MRSSSIVTWARRPCSRVRHKKDKTAPHRVIARGPARRRLRALAGGDRARQRDRVRGAAQGPEAGAHPQPLRASPRSTATCRVGSEPTSVALSPSGRTAYVANWDNGTVSVIDTATLKVTRHHRPQRRRWSRRATSATSSPRPALAHPRSITVSNDGDVDDGDESLLVTEYFAQQVERAAADGLNADVRRVGIVYKVELADYAVSTIKLSPLEDIGFKDVNRQRLPAASPTSCSRSRSTATSPTWSRCARRPRARGAEGDHQGRVSTVADCGRRPQAGGSGVRRGRVRQAPRVCVDVAGFKTATSPVVSVIDVERGHEVAGAAQNLNARFDAFFTRRKASTRAGQRFPLFANDLAFVPGTGVGYVTANGIDAVFRVVYDDKTGKLIEVGSSTCAVHRPQPRGHPAEQGWQGPDRHRDRRRQQEVRARGQRRHPQRDRARLQHAGDRRWARQPERHARRALPAKGSDEERILLGKELFNTGRARWSLRGQGWGACQSCHADGLTDNVTWYFARGPRQSTTLDGSFASKNALDQRILNYTANRDEVADFEINTRNISGGVGAIVLAKSTPPVEPRPHRHAGAQAGRARRLVAAGRRSRQSARARHRRRRQGRGRPALHRTRARSPQVVSSTTGQHHALRRRPSARRARPTNLDHAKVAAGRAAVRASTAPARAATAATSGPCPSSSTRPASPPTRRSRSPSSRCRRASPARSLPAEAPEDQKLVINAGGESVQCVMRNVQTFNWPSQASASPRCAAPT